MLERLQNCIQLTLSRSLLAPLAESKASMSQRCLCITCRLANSVGIDLAAVGSWLERTGPFVVLLCLIWFYKHITGKKFCHSAS